MSNLFLRCGLLLALVALAQPAPAQDKKKPAVNLATKTLGEILKLTASVGPADPFSADYRKDAAPGNFRVRPGETFLVTIKGKLVPKYYTYSIDQPADAYRIITEPFEWLQEIAVMPGTPAGKHEVPIKITLQVCERSCIQGDYPPLSVAVEVAEATGKVNKPTEHKSASNDGSVAPRITIGDGKFFVPIADVIEVAKTHEKRETSDPVAAATPSKSTKPGDVNVQDLGALLLAAFVGGFLMLLTPCVFPMIPITVNFFLKQSEKEHHRPLFLAIIYSGTIVLLLSLTMLVFGNMVVTLANDPIFNIALGAALVIFALSLFGMYEIELPSFLARFTSAHEGQGGIVGAFFMALTFTITSFTCTGPFIGIFLTPVAIQSASGQGPPFINLLLASVVYSATFAAPFFLLALFPSFLRKLPKSGGWLNAVKVTMGFVEIAAALKFLAVADYAIFPGQPRLFTYDAVLCAWIALSLASGLYLLGLFRLPHDDAQEKIGVVRMIFATVFLGLALYMTPLLWGIQPTGVVGENIVAFLPERLEEPAFAGGGSANLSWHKNDYVAAWEQAKREKKLIFIDFTGQNCPNCRTNERNVFPKEEVIEELKKYVRVKLYCDFVPDRMLSTSEARQLAAKFAGWRDSFGSAALPTYVVFQPDPARPLQDEMPSGRELGKRDGTIFDLADFVGFLREPVQGKGAVAAR